ncbi:MULTISPECIES: gas vesicle protein GvpG [Streptomyces]|uniref:Gas vesicle protein n=2 Tax=Streptomyces TaxID=1883 RepID=A0A1V0U5D1_STRVN|nr:MULTISPECIES: gas vesicle protein GvpG [Streptomyces]MYW80158.1 gas vesicle protein [Streptomyces sp. SID8369]NEA12303.1 gas vesicle protein [Streptomyces sp. SID10692]NEC45982.1 gas vesicle protein [Streptomyces sp. SID8016]ARF60152.1 gas vesicle protein [Streptomyces violaceoruber]KOG82450.1 gas vesicle protein [Streptomyces griseus subsp. rhodochrous]
MGLISNILTLPLAPVRGTVWVLDQVVQAAEQEYYDPEPVRARLAQLERDLNNGLIDDEEFDRLEDELLDRLDEIEAYRNSTRQGP